jgi:DNA-binding NarL/FixJ family response regulator
MLVDDHQTMLWGLQRLIESEWPRMEVAATACNGHEALEKAVAQPDVILLDLNLNGMCATELLPSLTAVTQARILILSAERRQSVLDAAMLRGARGIVHKEAPAVQVLKAIEKVHRGELWIDQQMLGRVFGNIMKPASPMPADPAMLKTSMLTARERTIIETIVRESGAPNKLIAQRLFISEHTLRNHLTSIYEKLGVTNRLELYIYAIKHGLGGEPEPQRPARRRASDAAPGKAELSRRHGKPLKTEEAFNRRG